MMTREIRYLYALKNILLRYPEGEYEVSLTDFYKKVFAETPSNHIYIDYIQESQNEVTFGFSNHKSYTVDFGKLLDIAKSIYTTNNHDSIKE